MEAGRWRVRALAWALMLGWHAVLGWLFWHGIRLPRGDGDAALAVVFLEAPPPRLRPAATEPAHAVRAGPRQPGQRSRPVAQPSPQATTPGALSVTVLAQAHALARRSAPMQVPVTDPFADRPARLSAADAGRFAMHRGLTPAQVVGKIGKLIGGPGYDPDPCPRNRRNLQNLIAAGDSKRLRMAMAFDREHCRP